MNPPVFDVENGRVYVFRNKQVTWKCNKFLYKIFTTRHNLFI